MAYFRQLEEQLQGLLAHVDREDRWLIVINADPDAMASAMALKRILSRRVADVGIGQTNEIKRLDNLAMAHYLRIPSRKIIPNLVAQYDKFALVDSQPCHNVEFSQFKFSIVIDHHPVSPDCKFDADYIEIKPEYGSCSTILTEYLYNLKIRPAKLLATALLFGIKNDTQSFERQFCDADVKAFRYLSKYADQLLLKRITRSEYHLDWLRYFSRAFYSQRRIGKSGMFTHIGRVENPDILVIVADFFTRVHEIAWNAVSGVYDDTLIVIFRSDGLGRDIGKFAASLFGEIGSAGGHRAAARAEIKISAIADQDPEKFVLTKLTRGKKTTKL